MKIELSPEVEADIRELLRLWDFDGSDPLNVEACARAMVKDGVKATIALVRELRGVPVPQSVPDARVFEETGDGMRDYKVIDPPLRFVQTPPDIAEGTQVRTTGGRLLVWRGGQWTEEGGAL